jgi:quercetin dioxygenase-like cupin family protein
MLSFRSRDGEAELHENFADVFYVLDGRATLVTGGTVAGAHRIGPGEMRGSSVEGGARQELRAGDVAHVPAGVPHQMLVVGEKTVTCLVMKVQEIP